MLRITLLAAFAALVCVGPAEDAFARDNHGKDRGKKHDKYPDPVGVPAPVAAAGLPALSALGAGLLALKRRRRHRQK